MTATSQPALAGTPSALARIYGLGSVFAKSLRDSRRAVILVAGLLGIVFIAVSAAIVTEFDTPASRAELEAIVAAVPPILQGLAGKVVNVGTLGGYLQYKYGTFFPLIVSLWSILALSGTLAGEAARGSLEFVASTGRSRRRVALEKLSAHLIGLLIATLVTFVALAIAGQAFAVLPGDEISITAAFAFAAWLGLVALAGGALAFALAPFIGRGAAAAIAGFVTFAGFILNGYQTPVPELAPFANLTWWGWTANHVALAGEFDWPAVALVAVVAIVLLAIGVEAFNRRDIGVTSSVPTLSLPRPLVGLGGPLGRTLSINLPAALTWGVGVGFFGLVLASAARGFVEQLANSPQFVQLLANVFPGIDFANAGGFLQLLFVEFGVVLAGLAAATFVAGWAGEETSRRLEMVLAAPLARARWASAGGAAMLASAILFVALTAVGIGLGAASSGSDIATPLVGSIVLGIYAAAVIGIGHAVGGVIGTRFATPVAVVFVLLTWFVQLVGPLLNLPDFVQQLALTRHYGQPLVGVWDLGGVAVSLAIAVGGIALGTWGFVRRDLRD